MKQILVTVDTNQPLQNIRKAINMLRGVVSTTVVKEPILTKTQKQQAFVKESLTRALQEVKLAKLEGRKLPDARDLLKVFTTPSVPLVGDGNPQGREAVTALRCSEPLRSKDSGPSKVSPDCAGWDRMGNTDTNIEESHHNSKDTIPCQWRITFSCRANSHILKLHVHHNTQAKQLLFHIE